MNLRLRKKLALGEFVEYGFDITGTWSPSDTDVDALIDAFDERGFLFAGTFGDKLDVFLTVCACRNRSGRRCSRVGTTDADRDVARRLLEQRGVANIVVGPLVDANRVEF